MIDNTEVCSQRNKHITTKLDAVIYYKLTIFSVNSKTLIIMWYLK